MVRRLVTAALISAVAAGCTSVSTGPTDAPASGVGPSAAASSSELAQSPALSIAPGPASTLAPPPTATQEWAFSGSSDKKTKPFTVSGTLRVSYTVSGSGNFIVDLMTTSGDTVASVANLIGSAKVTTWVYGASGRVYLDVTASGAWKVTVAQVDPVAAAVPATLSGKVSLTTAPVVLRGGETINWTYEGSDNFIVDVIDPTDGSAADDIANTIGKGSDSTAIYETGPYALDVTADGPWTISIKP